MPNKVRFSEFDEREVGLSKLEVRDLIDVLFRGNDVSITVYGEMTAENKTARGLCTYNEMFNTIDIHLSPARIKKSFNGNAPCGGNRQSISYKMAIAAVLAHELQHANQYQIHSSSHSSFFGKKKSKYRTRACEMEARNFADENTEVIAGVLGVKLPKTPFKIQMPDELQLIIETFLEASGSFVEMADITDELRLCGLNNAVNVTKVRSELQKSGLKIT